MSATYGDGAYGGGTYSDLTATVAFYSDGTYGSGTYANMAATVAFYSDGTYGSGTYADLISAISPTPGEAADQIIRRRRRRWSNR